MTAANETRLRFELLELDDAVRRDLAEIWPMVAARLPAILDRFYARLEALPETATILRDFATGGVERLKEAQRRHWEALFTGGLGPEYAERVVRIGRAHARIGLEPRWYLHAYCLIGNEIVATLHQALRWKPARATRLVQSANKAIFLDMDLALSVYFAEAQRMLAGERRQLAAEVDERVKALAEPLARSAAEMAEASQRLDAVARGVSQEAAQVSASSGTIFDHIQSVASATEEVSASVAEIDRQVGHAAAIARKGAAQAQETDSVVRGLSEATTSIGEVIKLIRDIAGQTNLLALNATIEAARAGEAGKGFAVVANEVKSLANQTATATENISSQITAINEATGQAIGVIHEIGRVIGEMNDIMTAIAASVDEQGAATREISGRIEATAGETSELLAAIRSVDRATREASGISGAVKDSAGALSGDSLALASTVEELVTRMRAAG